MKETGRFEAVERLYHAALERKEEERAAFLQSACEGDEELRREVESLLRHEGQDAVFSDAVEVEARRLAGASGSADSRPSLTRGARLGDYEVLSPLGAGGMGEVYRARDTRLERDVALKVLPHRFADDPARLARLNREARVLASLNHPHIATLYGVEESNGAPVLVMELVEGETLSDRLRRKRLPLAEALELGRQIAEGLEAAHEKDILHRDLKPANVRVTEKGRVKLLDFGLAKALVAEPDPEVSDSPASERPTDTSPATREGSVLGTAPYMSPEQARAEEVDRRTDVWAFGCVLFEMLSGRRAFEGVSAAGSVAAVLTKEPPWAALPESTPGAVVTLLKRCLRRPREERLGDVGVARQELEELLLQWRHGGRLEGAGPERSPYPGLRSFTEEDAGRFFGREAEVEGLWGRLQERRLLAVIGPSGAGKTSFVRAGVVPARPMGWAVLVTTPGASPLRNLGEALAPEIAGDPEALRKLVSFEDPAVALELLRRWRHEHVEALVVVDQFEEVFTLNGPEVQARFIELLGRLAAEGDVRVLLSLRDDFLIRCSEHAALAPVFESLTPMPPLTGEGLRRAVVEPASKEGFRFEDDALVDEMVSAVEGTRGALPLLAFAVSRLWEKRDRERHVLTRAAYGEMGGVAGALAQHADRVLERIGAERQTLVREMFRNLVTAQGTRAVMEREELLSVFPDRAAAEEVLAQLIDARLLTSYEAVEPAPSARGAESETGDEGSAAPGSPDRTTHRIEIVHESLLTAWPRLVMWQAQEKEGAVLRDQLKQAAHLWDEKGRPEELVWTGRAHLEYRAWRSRYSGGLSALEEDFARAMTELAGRQRRRRRIVGATVVAVLALGFAAVSIFWARAEVARKRAESETRQREAAQLVSLGRLQLETHPMAALAHAIASLERADNAAARCFALEALWRGPTSMAFSDTIPPVAPAWSPDGRWLAFGGPRGLVVLGQDGRERHPLINRGEMPLFFNDDGSRLVSALWNEFPQKELRVWSLPDGELLHSIELDPPAAVSHTDDELLTFAAREWGDPVTVGARSIEGGPETILGLWRPGRVKAFGLDPERWKLVWVTGDRVLQQRLDDLDEAPLFLGRHEGVTSIRVRRGTDRVVTSDEDGGVRVWDTRSGRLVRSLRSPASAQRLALDHQGRFIATAPPFAQPAPGSLVLFDLQGPRGAEPQRLMNHDLMMFLNAMAFDPKGRWLASGHAGTLALWNLTSRRASVFRKQNPPWIGVTFTSDGRLVSTSDEGVVRLWPLFQEGGDDVQELWSADGDGSIAGLFATVDPELRFVVILQRFKGRALLVPLDGSTPTTHDAEPVVGQAVIGNPSLDPTGERLAVSHFEFGHPEAGSVRIFNLASGEQRTLRADTGLEGCAGPMEALGAADIPVWLPDGRLVSHGATGLRVWDLATATNHLLHPCQPGDDRERRLLATPDSASVLSLAAARSGEGHPSVLTRYDLQSGRSHEITSYGNRIRCIALDAEGRILVTGGDDGVVRAGLISGVEPHLLYGHTQTVSSVAVSPDGEWIASASNDGTIRLWPMPEGPPLHTLPFEELLAKLRAQTNLRVVPDPASATGYSVEPGPFPGWATAPEW